MPKFDLRKEAAGFAHDLSVLLNGTVCNGVRLKTVITDPSRSRAVIGYQIGKRDLDQTTGIPITLGAKAPSGYLGVQFRLGTDDERRYLMVVSSFMGLFLDATLDKPLMHYDYERDKGDGYPEAHLQVCAGSTTWDQLCSATRGDVRPFERLHLPVGGRRFRPTLEDMVDFLVTEQLAEARPDAAEAITEGRERFRRLQLRAAIRRDPETAIEALKEHDLLPRPKDEDGSGGRTR